VLVVAFVDCFLVVEVVAVFGGVAGYVGTVEIHIQESVVVTVELGMGATWYSAARTHNDCLLAQG